MAKKKEEFEDEDDEEEDLDDEEEDDFEEEKFTCRVCKKQVTVDEGEDNFALCDNCAKNFDVEKIWADFDNEKILEENLKTFDLEKYRLKPKEPKKKTTVKK